MSTLQDRAVIKKGLLSYTHQEGISVEFITFIYIKSKSIIKNTKRNEKQEKSIH